MIGDAEDQMRTEELEQGLGGGPEGINAKESIFCFQIGKKGLAFEVHTIDDPVPSCRQILTSAGYRPADEYLLFHWRHGVLQEIELDDTVDLRVAGMERFIAFQSDRSFRFELAGQRWEWGANKIQAAIVKELAGVDAKTHELFLEKNNVPDQLIEDDKFVDLSEHGIERLVIKEMKNFDIIVNTREEVVSDRNVTFEQVVALAFPGAPPPGDVIYSMTFRNVASIPHAGELAAGGSVKVKRHGSIFNVTRTVQS